VGSSFNLSDHEAARNFIEVLVIDTQDILHSSSLKDIVTIRLGFISNTMLNG
jgi:hypothetical protein